MFISHKIYNKHTKRKRKNERSGVYAIRIPSHPSSAAYHLLVSVYQRNFSEDLQPLEKDNISTCTAREKVIEPTKKSTKKLRETTANENEWTRTKKNIYYEN